MTARAEYTAEEWQLLQMTPYAVGLAVSFSDGTGVLETFNEVAALASERSRAVAHYPGNELVAALLGDRSQTPSPQVEQSAADGGGADLPATLKARAFEDCREVIALLNERSHPVEADGYKHFLMDVARATAKASRHGGWMRRGPAVDDAERAVLCELADLLGVEVDEAGEISCPESGPDATGPDRDVPPQPRDEGPEIPTGPIHPE